MDKFRDPNGDYSKNITYEIRHKTDDETPPYFGSTCKGEIVRWNKHVYDFLNNRYTDNHKLYMTFKEYGYENFELVKIEDWPCANYDEARQRETYWCNQYDETLNSKTPYVSAEERRLKNIEYGKTKIICEDCGLEINKYNLSSHKNTDHHIHLSKVKKMINNNGDQKIDKYLILPSKKILCCCYLEFDRMDSYNSHIKHSFHDKFMKLINQFRIEFNKKNQNKDLIQLNILPNENMICDCGSDIKTRDYQHHLTLGIHKELLEIRERIRLEFENKKIEIPYKKSLCNKCYVFYSSDNKYQHLKTEKHTILYPEIVLRIKELFKKQRETNNLNLKFSEITDLVKIEIFPTGIIQDIKSTPSEVLSPNEEFICDCGSMVTKKIYDSHLEHPSHKDLMKIRSRIELEMEKRKIEIGDKRVMCSKCYMLYGKNDPGRHNNTKKHSEYSKIVPIIKDLLKKKKEPENKNKQFRELRNDLVKVDIIPMLNLV